MALSAPLAQLRSRKRPVNPPYSLAETVLYAIKCDQSTMGGNLASYRRISTKAESCSSRVERLPPSAPSRRTRLIVLGGLTGGVGRGRTTAVALRLISPRSHSRSLAS